MEIPLDFIVETAGIHEEVSELESMSCEYLEGYRCYTTPVIAAKKELVLYFNF